MKVAFLTNIVSPYRRPVFEELAATPGWQLSVIVNARTEFDRGGWDAARGAGFEVTRTRSFRWRRKHVSLEPVRAEQVVTRYLPVGLWGDLRRLRPDVVITHELGPRSLVASLYCRLHRIPMVVWSYQSRAGATARGAIRRLVRDRILNRADAVVGMGRQARAVLEGYGVPAAKIVDAPNATDTTLLLERLARSRADRTIERLRGEIGRGRRIALLPGRLVPFKGIERLLELWRELPAPLRSDWLLLLVGDGPLAPLVETHAEHGVQRLPAVPMGEIADFYGIADLCVFPSLADCWGLVVNEAMLCSVPCLCSVHAGCADDLVTDGQNGLTFDPTDRGRALDELGAALSRDDLEALGARAAQKGAEFTVSRLAAAFRVAVDAALAARSTADRPTSTRRPRSATTICTSSSPAPTRAQHGPR